MRPDLVLLAALATLVLVAPSPAAADPPADTMTDCGEKFATGTCREDCGDFPCCHYLWVPGQREGVVWCEV